jgi:cytochrome c peroxidase
VADETAPDGGRPTVDVDAAATRCLVVHKNVVYKRRVAVQAANAAPAELKGEVLFNGKAQCFVCHPAPYYTDNSMHNLKTERFYQPRMINGRMASADGPIKTFALRGIKDSPPYLHDDRLLTLEDTVEFFNLILQTKLNEEEKKDLVTFMRVL